MSTTGEDEYKAWKRAEILYEACKMRNTSGLSVGELVELDFECERARVRAVAAEKEYRAKIQNRMEFLR